MKSILSGGKPTIGRSFAFIAAVAVLLCACNSPADPVSPVEPPTPDPDPEPEPVELSTAISEDFSGELSPLLDMNIRTAREDFRYFSSFPSFTERGTEVMLMRIDPSDAAGIKRGPSVTSNKKCLYGSYSTRFRVPGTLKAQPNLGVCASLTLTDNEAQLALEVRVSDPTAVYLVFPDGEDVVRPDGFNASTAFHIYGIDWSEDSILWWLKTSEKSEKIVIKEIPSESFTNPAYYSLNYYYSKLKPVKGNPNSIQAPLYPYELELDQMSYAPAE